MPLPETGLLVYDLEDRFGSQDGHLVDVKAGCRKPRVSRIGFVRNFWPYSTVREHDTIGHFSSHSRDLAEKWPKMGFARPLLNVFNTLGFVPHFLYDTFGHYSSLFTTFAPFARQKRHGF